MSNIEKNLNKNENILLKNQIHWIIFFNPFVLFSLILMATYKFSFVGFHYLYIVILIFGLIFGLIIYKTTQYILTNKRIIKTFGFIEINIQDIKLEKIESIEMSQSILGRILNYGTIYCKGIGSSILIIDNVSNPLKFKNEISELISN